MYKSEGYWNVEPKIKSLSFPKRGKFQVELEDGRNIPMLWMLSQMLEFFVCHGMVILRIGVSS